MMDKKKVFFILVVACLLGAAVYAASSVTAVVLYDEAGKERFLFSPADGRFTVRFLHSWARSPVDEIFEISGDVPVLTGTVYEDFGAGLPHEPETARGSMKLENGKIRIDGMERPVPNLQVRVGRFVANHELLYDGRKIPLSRFFSPGDAVVFRVRKIPRCTLWLNTRLHSNDT